MKVKSLARLLGRLLLNMWRGLKIRKIELIVKDGVIIKGLDRNNFNDAVAMYEKYSTSEKMPLFNKLLFFLIGGRTCFVAESGQGDVLGIELYYFNRKDFSQGTVHQAFTGVDEFARGQGVATKLRQSALHHFKEAGLKGISSRVSLSNQTSLSINKKIGFRPVEQYYDERMGEERYYLVLWL